MKNQDQLFELIKSLDRNEKGYFKKFTSGQHREKKYLKLFEAIEKQSREPSGEFNEKKILKQFTGEKLVKRFAVAKSYLYNLILKSLRNYYSESSIDTLLNALLHNANILYSKGLYKSCLKIIARAENLSIAYEKFEFLLMLKELEKRTIIAGGRTVVEMMEGQQEILRKIQNLQTYGLLYQKMFSLLNYQAIRDAPTLEEYKSIIQDPLLKDKNNALSSRALRLFHSIYGLYTLSIGDHKKAYDHYKQVLELMELHAEKTKEWADDYLSALNNLMIGTMALRKNKETETLVNKMRTLNYEKSEHIDIKIFTRSYNIELGLLSETGHTQKTLSLIPEIEKGIQKFDKKISAEYLLTFYSQFFYACFENGLYKEAIKWLEKVLNNTEAPQTQDNHCFAKILNIIVHYELGNEEFLKYSIVSTYRFLYKRKRLYKLEESLLNYIRKNLFNVNTKEKQKRLFKKLYSELSMIFEDPFEKRALEYFPFLEWLQSKIENRSFAEIVKKSRMQNKALPH